MIIPLEYSFITNFKDGLAIVSKNNKYGFINETGTVIVALEYDLISPFDEDYEGMAWVVKNGKYFYINKKGECVKNCE